MAHLSSLVHSVGKKYHLGTGLPDFIPEDAFHRTVIYIMHSFLSTFIFGSQF